MDGIILMNKPTGLTSAQFLNQLKAALRPYQVAKIGHGGTLDKFASGLLIVGLGRRFTKQLSLFLKDSRKEYEAEIEFGQESSTLDPEGDIAPLGTCPTPKEISAALKTFPLNIPFSQIAPLYSAKKIAGRRLSDLTRQNQVVKPKSSLVTLYKYSLLDYAPPLLKVRLTVSSGFYIRAFARDLASRLATAAYVKSLKRTAIFLNHQKFSLSQSLTLDQLNRNLSLTIFLTGYVQGISLRAYTRAKLNQLKLSGQAVNNPDGSVTITASGPLSKLITLSKAVLASPPSLTDYSLLWRQ